MEVASSEPDLRVRKHEAPARAAGDFRHDGQPSSASREVAASGRGYAVLGPWAIAPDVRAGRLRAARIVKPNLTRFVTLASSSQGAMTPAIRIVIATLKEIASELAKSGVYDGLAT